MDVEGQVLDIVRVADEDFAVRVFEVVKVRLLELGHLSALGGLEEVSAPKKKRPVSIWAKTIESVDYTKRKATGFSIKGNWVENPKDLIGLPHGTLVLVWAKGELAILKADASFNAVVGAHDYYIVNGGKWLGKSALGSYEWVVQWCRENGVEQSKSVEAAA